jgi:hypothetical protein
MACSGHIRHTFDERCRKTGRFFGQAPLLSAQRNLRLCTRHLEICQSLPVTAQLSYSLLFVAVLGACALRALSNEILCCCGVALQ